MISLLNSRYAKQNHLCVVGNYKNINDESSMFDEIKPLFVSAVQNNSEEE